MSDTVTITGLKELKSLLKTLPVKMELNVMRGALSAGARVIRDSAKAMVPVAPPNAENKRLYGGRYGALRDSIRVGSRIKKGKGNVTAYIRAGGKKNGADTFYAKFVEYGTRPHLINSKSGWISINGNKVRAPVQHPGAKAHPFLRPALDGERARAVIVVGNYIKNRLATKNGINTAGINVAPEIE